MSDDKEKMSDDKVKCVYTALLGGYETLVEQPKALESSIDFICLTDDPDLTSETWQVKVIKPVLPLDLVRSQRQLKILGHPFLEKYRQSLYIDNQMQLTELPEAIFDHYANTSPLVIPLHSFRKTLSDEFRVVAKLLLDDPARVAEQRDHYSQLFPHILDQRPYASGILIRNHDDEKVQEAMKIWHAQMMRYSRRDQLSTNAAIEMSGVDVYGYEVENHTSWFHIWVHDTGRSPQKRNWHEFGWSPKYALKRRINWFRDKSLFGKTEETKPQKWFRCGLGAI